MNAPTAHVLSHQPKSAVAIYELKEAELNGLEGQGYAYSVKTFRGKEYKGVFFAEDAEAVEEALNGGAVEFTGVVYDRTRERNETFEVDVVKTLSAGIGHRADFVAVEDP